jgi:hypothetical protein
VFWKPKDSTPTLKELIEQNSELGQLSKLYFERLSEWAKGARRVSESEIQASIEEKGYWEDFIEWRISTITEMRVEPIERDGKRWYKVRVACGHEWVCYCPTIERAVEFLSIYERLLADLFWAVGWPSWAAANQLES